MEIKAFYDARTFTLTYVAFDAETKDALVIDPVMDYDPVGSKVFTDSVDEVTEYLKAEGLKLHWVLETHAHADHLSGAQLLKERFPGSKTGIGERITVVQEKFKEVFSLPDDFPTDGRQFDKLIADGETVKAGSVEVKMIFTPGHTPACGTYQIDDALFTGDALFMPDMGTGRCDFPAGSADDLYASIKRLYELPASMRVFVGHDYQPGGRQLAYESTIGEEKEKNIQLTAGTSREDFVKFRTERDATLNAPKLLFQSIQVNIDAGKLPEPSENEMRYLKIPVNVFRPEGTLSPEQKGDVKLDTV